MHTKIIDATNNLQSNALVSMPFYCYTWMMNSCCWAVPPYTCCNLNFYFLCFSRNRFINNWKSQSSNSCNCIFISFVVHDIIMLCNSCFGLCNFLFALFGRRDTQHQQNTYLQGMQTLSISHSLLDLLPHSYVASLYHLWMHCLTKIVYLEPVSLLSWLLSFLPDSFSAYPKCTLTPRSKITKLLYGLRTTVISLFPLLNKPKKLV